MQRAGLVGIDYARNLAPVVVIDLHHHAVCPNLEPASALGLRDLGIEARPFSADGAARHAEADLMAGRAIVPRLGVDRHVARVDILVSHALGARSHDFEVVIARQTRDVVSSGHAQLVLGARIVWLHLPERNRPVEQIGAFDVAVDGARPELVFLEAQRCAGPVHGRAAHGLTHPQRQCRIEIAGAYALVEPTQPAEHGGIVVDDVGERETRPGLQAHHIDAALG